MLARWGKAIAIFRERMDLSQQELADRLGVAYPTVWRWENGKMEPRRHHKKRLAEELNTVEQAIFS